MVSSKGKVSFLSKNIWGMYTLGYSILCFRIFRNVALILLLVNLICFGFMVLVLRTLMLVLVFMLCFTVSPFQRFTVSHTFFLSEGESMKCQFSYVSLFTVKTYLVNLSPLSDLFGPVLSSCTVT